MTVSPARLLAGLCAALALLCACTAAPPAPVTLRVLATPELAGIEPLLADLRAERGVDLQLDMGHGLDAVGALRPGGYDHDAAWLSSDRYFQLEFAASGDTGPRPLSTPIMLSPVVVGMTRATAERLAGGGPVSWADIAASAAAGELRFGMADPRRSGSGLAALVGVATAAAGTGRALQPEDVTCDRLRGFFTGHALSAGSSAELVDGFVARHGELDALVAPESALLALNAGGRLGEPLEIVYPADGIIQSEFPLVLLNPAQRDAYDRAVEWLLSEPVQQRIMEQTGRRPIDPDVPRLRQLPATTGNALYFPDRLEVIDALLADYEAIGTSPPAHVIFLLDFSGSMRGERIAALRDAFTQLTGGGEASFVRFHDGERITVVRFGGGVLAEREFAGGDPAEMAALRDFVGVEAFDDRTAVWSAAEHAYGIAGRVLAADPARPVPVVLMTDGINNAGLSADQFLAGAPGRPAVPVFTIRVGEADPAELARVATATGGRSVDAGPDVSTLSAAFEELRGCR